MKLGALAAIACAVAGCSPTAAPAPSSPPAMTTPDPTPAEPPAEPATSERPAPWSFVYGDGSGNVSRVTRSDADAPIEFVYEPITPERSSTGMYSGGDPRHARIEPHDPRIAAMWAEIERLEADTSIHGDARAKGTGSFHITTPSGERSFIVSSRPALAEIERILAGFGT